MVFEDENNTCPDCKGQGEIVLFTSIEAPCKTCMGLGMVSSQDDIVLTFEHNLGAGYGNASALRKLNIPSMD